MTAITAPAARAITTARFLRALAVAGLATAGAIHLILVPGHLEMSPTLAFGFLAAGWTQVALAVGLIVGPARRLLILVVIASALFLGLYVYDVTVGLPLASHAGVHSEPEPHGHGGTAHEGAAHHSAPTVLEPVAFAAKSAELVTLVAAGALLSRTRREQRRATRIEA